MQHGSPLILLVGKDGQRTLPCLVQRGWSTKIPLAAYGDMSIGINDNSRLLGRLVDSNRLIVKWIDEPLTVTCTLERLNVDDVGLFGTCFHGQFRRVVRLQVAAVGTEPHHVGRSGFQGFAANGECPALSAPYFHESVVLLQLHDEAVFALGIVGPLQRQAVGGRRCQRQQHRGTQEELTVCPADAIDIVLDMGIAVGGDYHSVVLRRVSTIGLFPLVGHSVLVGVQRLLAGVHLPGIGCADGQFILVGNEFAFLAIRQHLGHHIAVGQIAIRQRCADLRQQLRAEFLAAPLLQFRIFVGLGLTVASTVVGQFCRVQQAVSVGVLPIVDAVEVEVLVTSRQSAATCGRAVDKEVRLDVGIRLPLRIATHVVGSILPVVDDVVGILVHALHLKVTSGIVDHQDAVERNVLGLHQSACRVSHQSLPHDAVHQRDVLRRRTLVIPVDTEVLVLSPCKRTMVEYHVAPVGHASTVLVLGAYGSHPEAHVADDDIVGTRERHAVAIDGDALSRSRLSGHIEVVLEHDAAVDANDACHIKHHDAVGLAHGIAQRTRSRIVQVGHMINLARASTCGKTPPALRLGEGQLLGLQHRAAQQ